MDEVVDDLYRTRSERPFGNVVQTVAWLLLRDEGNLLFYSSGFIEEYLGFIEARGGVAWQLVNHRDEATSSCDVVEERFEAPLVCHVLEREAISEKCRVGRVILEHQRTFEGLQVIHTPGHCPGSTCFLLPRPNGNVLFTGDTLYPTNGRWGVAIGDGHQQEMISSLETLAALDVSVVIPSLFIGDADHGRFHERGSYTEMIQSCIERLRHGATH